MTSKTTVLCVVIFVGSATLLGIAGIAVLAALEQPIPDTLGVVTGTALGGLVTLLANTRSTLGAADVEPTPLVPSPPAVVEIPPTADTDPFTWPMSPSSSEVNADPVTVVPEGSVTEIPDALAGGVVGDDPRRYLSLARDDPRRIEAERILKERSGPAVSPRQAGALWTDAGGGAGMGLGAL